MKLVVRRSHTIAMIAASIAWFSTACGGGDISLGSRPAPTKGADGVSGIDASTADATAGTSGGGLPVGPSSASGGPSQAAPPPSSLPSLFANPLTAGRGCSLGSGAGAATQGPTGCTVTFGETCGDAGYQTVCACPQGTCACLGSSTSVVSFAGCPACPTNAEAFTLCGFPL
jgi:hypothetical protein